MSTRLKMKKRQTKIRCFAIEVFGSKRKAAQWLKTPHLIYGKSPICVCKTSNGFEEIRKTLTSIAFGGVV